MSLTTLLDEILEAWQYTRAGVVSEIKNLPDASLTFRPSAESRSAAEIAVHIAESGLMMAGELSRRLRKVADGLTSIEGPCVSRVSLPVAASARHTSALPEREEKKTTADPSGVNRGW